MECVVNLIWDTEAGIWYTESDDIPGLVLGSSSFDDLIKRVRIAAPEMIEENIGYTGVFNILFTAQRIEPAFITEKESIVV